MLFTLEGPDDEILVMRARPHATVPPDWADRAYRVVNEWNHTRRFCKAYVGDPTERGQLPIYAELQVPLALRRARRAAGRDARLRRRGRHAPSSTGCTTRARCSRSGSYARVRRGRDRSLPRAPGSPEGARPARLRVQPSGGVRRTSDLRDRNIRLVLAKLRRRWSTTADRGVRLAVDVPEPAELRVSHETIYQACTCSPRGNLRAELTAQVASAVRAGCPPAAVTGHLLRPGPTASRGSVACTSRPDRRG